MDDRPRFVVDTNVLIDALCFKHSFGRRAFDHARLEGTVVWSPATMAELVEVAYRPRLARYVDEDLRLAFLSWIETHGQHVQPNERFAVCRDPQDDKFLELVPGTRRRGSCDCNPHA